MFNPAVRTIRLQRRSNCAVSFWRHAIPRFWILERMIGPAERSNNWVRALCALFFFAGFPALIYQLVWQRALFRILGVNIESVTIVVTAFMLGLGVGSLVGGWLSKRGRIQPLPALAVIELLTGIFGVSSLAIFEKVGELTTGLNLVATGTVALALVIAPTLLMGATLPLLVGHLVRQSGNVGSAVGLLYYTNTLGAGAACVVSAVLLFPFLGMNGSIYVAAAMNGAVALGALIAHRRHGPESAGIRSDAASTSFSAERGLAPFVLLAAAGGFVSLSYEIFFFRTVSYATGSSATAFAATLSAFLLGVASGAREAGRRCETATRADLMRFAVRALVIANVAGVLFLPLLNHLTWMHRNIVVVILLLVYLVARFWGSLLPYLSGLAIRADSNAGMNTALFYLANITGAAAGSIFTGFVLMEYFGLVAVGTILAAAGSLCTMLLVAALPFPRRKLPSAALAAGIGLTGVIAIPYGSMNVLESLHWKGAADAQPLDQVVENRSGIITVTRNRTVYGNGMFDGAFNVDLNHDTNGIVRPYALSLFHPAPRHVLMIGLASGSWAQVIAANPEVETLTIVEINPGYLALIRTAPEVQTLLANPKVTVVIDDGRRWLRANPARRFDAIVSNTTWHFRANVTNLLSYEFLAIVRRHLNRDGIFFYNTTSSVRVQRTGCASFAHGARFINHLVVSDWPIAWDFARWRRTLESYVIDGRSMLNAARDDDRAKLGELASWEESFGVAMEKPRPIEPCLEILARTAGKALITDDNMGAEWRSFLGLE
jgi:spermidine synthase